MKIGTNNLIKGKVIELKEGSEMGIITIDIGGGNKISSVTTMESINQLGLKIGSEAYAMFKATSVLVAVE